MDGDGLTTFPSLILEAEFSAVPAHGGGLETLCPPWLLTAFCIKMITTAMIMKTLMIMLIKTTVFVPSQLLKP